MLTEADELSEACNDGLVHVDGDANPDGVTYEVRVGCCEELIVDVIEDDFVRYGVGVSESIVDTDTIGVEDGDAEELNELVELDEPDVEDDAETELDADKVVETVNLLV
jgi:hypothetical protein